MAKEMSEHCSVASENVRICVPQFSEFVIIECMYISFQVPPLKIKSHICKNMSLRIIKCKEH